MDHPAKCKRVTMSNWRPDFQPEHLYFITTKAVDHADLFQRDIIKRLLIDMLDSFRCQRRWLLFCFVIMPNHWHLIAQFQATIRWLTSCVI